jgi:uncharacterized protein YecT (DUF1311 family)
MRGAVIMVFAGIAALSISSAPVRAQTTDLIPRWDDDQPSFDCATAKMAAARLICADAELARLDRELGAAFQKQKLQVFPPDQSRFIADELAWIKDRNTRCGLVGKNDSVIATLASSKPCLLDAIRERIAFLGGFEQRASISANSPPDGNMMQPSLQPSAQAPQSIWPDPGLALAPPPPKEERTFDQSKIAALLDKRDPAMSALDEIVTTMANFDSTQLTSALNVMVSPSARVASDTDSKLYGNLGDCAAFAVNRGSRSTANMLQKDCGDEYHAWFPTCIQTGQTTKACAAMALLMIRVAIEAFEKYCVGATAEDASRFECAGKPSTPKDSETISAPVQPNRPGIVVVIAVVGFIIAFVASPAFRKICIALPIVVLCLWVSYRSFGELVSKDPSGESFLDGVHNNLQALSLRLKGIDSDLEADIARREAARSTEADRESRSVQWDQNKAIQNVRFDHAINEMHICARDAATIALRTGVRNREQIVSTVVSLCKAQLAFLFTEAKATEVSSKDQSDLAMSLIDGEMDSAIRSGR